MVQPVLFCMHGTSTAPKRVRATANDGLRFFFLGHIWDLNNIACNIHHTELLVCIFFPATFCDIDVTKPTAAECHASQKAIAGDEHSKSAQPKLPFLQKIKKGKKNEESSSFFLFLKDRQIDS
jgi:hypothetical protein